MFKQNLLTEVLKCKSLGNGDEISYECYQCSAKQNVKRGQEVYILMELREQDDGMPQAFEATAGLCRSCFNPSNPLHGRVTLIRIPKV